MLSNCAAAQVAQSVEQGTENPFPRRLKPSPKIDYRAARLALGMTPDEAERAARRTRVLGKRVARGEISLQQGAGSDRRGRRGPSRRPFHQGASLRDRMKHVARQRTSQTERDTMQLYARQGDLVIQRLDKAPTEELSEMKSVVFAGDSSGHPHMLTGKVMARRVGRRTLVTVTANREITHGKPDGHKTVLLKGSKAKPGHYEVRPLRERGDGSDRAVED